MPDVARGFGCQRNLREMMEHDRRVVEGCKLPSTAPLTENERDWIDMLRSVSGDSDPPLSVAGAKALRAVMSGGE